MFIGHLVVGFAAKRIATGPSLRTYFMAVTFLDLLWPPLLLAGIEHVKIEPGNTAHTPLAFIDYPFSHSLLTTIIWFLLFYTMRRDRIGSMHTSWMRKPRRHRASESLRRLPSVGGCLCGGGVDREASKNGGSLPSVAAGR